MWFYIQSLIQFKQKIRVSNLVFTILLYINTELLTKKELIGRIRYALT